MGAYNEELVNAGHHARRRGAEAELRGRAGGVRGRHDVGGRRAVHGVQGDHRGLLDLAGAARSRRRSSGPSAARRPRQLRSVLEIRPIFEMEDFGDECHAGVCASGRRRSRTRINASSTPAAEPMDARRTVEAIWRIESPRLIASLTRLVRDVGLAEELAQDAFVAGARAVAAARRPGQARCLADGHRQAQGDRPDPARAGAATRSTRRSPSTLRAARRRPDAGSPTTPSATTCSRWCSSRATRCSRRESRVALTLRLLGGLTHRRDRAGVPRPRPRRSGSGSRAPSARSPRRTSRSRCRRPTSCRRGCRRCSR